MAGDFRVAGSGGTMIFGLRLAKSDVDLTVGFAKGKSVAFSGWLCKGGMWRFAVGLASARLPGLQGCETMIPVRADRNVAVADSRWRSFPLRGPLPFSGANAACGYLPLQLTQRPFVIGILFS